MKDVKLKASTVMTENVLLENRFTIRTILSAFFTLKLKKIFIELSFICVFSGK